MRFLSYNRSFGLERWDAIGSMGVDITLMQGERRGRRSEDEGPERPFERKVNCLIPTSERVRVERISSSSAMVSNERRRILVMGMFFKREEWLELPLLARHRCLYHYDHQIQRYRTIDPNLQVIAAGSKQDLTTPADDLFDRMRRVGMVPIGELAKEIADYSVNSVIRTSNRWDAQIQYVFATESLAPHVRAHAVACGAIIDVL